MNVLVDVILIVKKFLRVLIENEIIFFKFKSCLSFKYCVVFERICLSKVIEVIKWLI